MLEKEKMRELIEELKQANSFYASERDIFEDKVKAKIAKMHKFASQCQINSQQSIMLEKLLAEYKNSLNDLQMSQNASNGAADISQIKAGLATKEDELRCKFKEESGRVLANVKVDP